MAAWHLEDLRNALEKSGWRVTDELQGDEYKISATWRIRRNSPVMTLSIDFNGLDDMRTLPIEQSYGCSVREKPGCDLYFGRKGLKGSDQRTRWQSDLKGFVATLEGPR